MRKEKNNTDTHNIKCFIYVPETRVLQDMCLIKKNKWIYLK